MAIITTASIPVLLPIIADLVRLSLEKRRELTEAEMQTALESFIDSDDELQARRS